MKQAWLIAVALVLCALVAQAVGYVAVDPAGVEAAADRPETAPESHFRQYQQYRETLLQPLHTVDCR